MNGPNIIIIADSGSTKTDWAWLENGQEAGSFSTEGYNPYFADTPFIVASVAPHIPATCSRGRVTEVHFYGSGCFDERVPIVAHAMKELFPNATPFVKLDLLGSARALLGDEPGFAAILGTGTNTCLYDGVDIKMNIDSLGYLLGDEGSGTHLGKKLLADLIREKLPPDTRDALLAQYPIDKEIIFEHIYSKPFPNRYCAAFTPFMLERMQQGDHYVRDLVKGSFQELFQNLVSQYPGYQGLRFNCVGSIGHYFREPLLEVAAEFGMPAGKIIKTPIEGLVRYHSGSGQWAVGGVQ
jgi:glucosamine kinase